MNQSGIQATNVVGLKMVDCSIRLRKGPLVTLIDNRNALLQELTGPKETKVLLRLEGAGTQGIPFLPANTSDAGCVESAPEVGKQQVTD